MNVMNFVQNEIKSTGKMTVDRFLEIVLYHKDFGYYFNNAIIGRDGDYITAPEITQIFGELLALLIVEQWTLKGCLKPIQLIELGPGRGTLMADMTRVFQKFSSFYENLEIAFVDISPPFRKTQQAKVQHHTITWHDSLDTILPNPDGFTFILANEFFDALPIKQFCMQDEKLKERVLKLGPGDRIVFLPESGDVVETCPYYPVVIDNVNRLLSGNAGAFLFIDYGDSLTDRKGDTLQALNRHTYESILFDPGKTDISHNVNFHALQGLLSPKFEIYPLMTQGDFLQNLGIEARMQALLEKCQTASQKMSIMSGCARLIAPNHMGEIFKVLYGTT